MSAPKEIEIVWLISTMGYGSQLLYWEPILRGYVSRFPNCRVLTTGTQTSERKDSLPIERIVKTFRYRLWRTTGDYPKLLILMSPGIIGHIRKSAPSLLVLSEFGLLTIYGIIALLFLPKTRTLLLVESDPRSLASGWFSLLKRWVRKLICRRCDAILTNNDAGYRYLTTTLGVPANKILKSIYLVSQPEMNTPHSQTDVDIQLDLRHEKSDYIAFLYVGQLTTRKGVHNLVRAVSLLPPHILSRCRVWIVGDGEEKAAIESVIQAAGLIDRIRLFGKQPYDNLAFFYRNADVFVLPTLHDYRALVGFEALNFGLPLLHSTGDGAAAEVVIENGNGFTFAPDDIAALSRHITWFIEHPDMIPRFSRQSRALSEQFTTQKAVDSLVLGTERALGIRPELS